MYGKFFQSTFTGSMRGAGPVVFAVWGYVIANSYGGQVELNPPLVAFMIGCEVADVELAIEFLCAPDQKSRSKAEEGRRLIKEGEFAYRIVNYGLYSEIKNADELREYNRLAKQKSREKKGSQQCQECQDVKQDVKRPLLLSSSSTSASEGKRVQGEGEQVTDCNYTSVTPPLPLGLGVKTPEETPRNAAVTDDYAEQLYKIYPRHQAKGAALKAIKKAASIAPFSLLKERTAAFAEAVSRWPADSCEFVPLASTWFNQERWEDDPKTWERIAPTNGQQDKSRLARELLARIESAKSHLAKVSNEILRIPIDTPEKAQKRAEIDAAQRKLDDLRKEHALL